MASQFVNDGLNPQHKELIAQVQSEVQVLLAWPIIEDGIHKRHDCSLETHFIPVDTSAAVQVIHNPLFTKHKVADEI